MERLTRSIAVIIIIVIIIYSRSDSRSHRDLVHLV